MTIKVRRGVSRTRRALMVSLRLHKGAQADDLCGRGTWVAGIGGVPQGPLKGV